MQLAWEQKMAISRLLTLDTEKEDHLGLALFQALTQKSTQRDHARSRIQLGCGDTRTRKEGSSIAKRHGIAN